MDNIIETIFYGIVTIIIGLIFAFFIVAIVKFLSIFIIVYIPILYNYILDLIIYTVGYIRSGLS